MKLNGTTYKAVDCEDHEKIDRRAFLAKSIVCTTAFTMLAAPSVISSVFASQTEKTNEKTFKELDEKVVKYFEMYKTCSQPCYAALNEQFEMKADRAIFALRPFAGGIVGKGETCGAVSGTLLSIGAYYEPSNQNESKKVGSSMIYARQFFDRFTEEFDHTRCREVIKHQYGRYYNWNNQEELNLYKEAVASAKDMKRLEVVRTAVRIAADIILKNS